MLEGIQLRSITFLLTYKCNYACKHCFVFASPKYSEVASIDDTYKMLAIINRENSLKSVCIFGGEPFLFTDRFIEIVKLFKRNGIDDLSTITNGYWATDEVKALEIASKIKSSGLNTLVFSLDPYHIRRIDNRKELLRNAIMATYKSNIPNIVLNVKYAEDRNSGNIIDLEMNELKHEFSSLPGVKIRSRINEDGTDHILYVGRASKLLANKFKGKKERILNHCPLEKRFQGFSFVQKAYVDLNGNVLPCPGISILNLKKNTAEEDFSSYQYQNNPIIKYLVTKGPKGLLELPEAEDFDNSLEFINTCHYCYELRNHLHNFYPKTLIKSYYEEYIGKR